MLRPNLTLFQQRLLFLQERLMACLTPQKLINFLTYEEYYTLIFHFVNDKMNLFLNVMH